VIAPFLAAVAVALPAAHAARPQLSLQPFASGLQSLTAIASTRAEPNRLYAVQQDGRIVYFVKGRLRGTFIDLRDRVTSGGEQGLLSVAFHPNYRRNHRFYVDYTDKQGNTRVVEFRSRNGRGLKSTARQLLFVRQPYANHNGGQLQFDRRGLLYVGMGDGGSAGDPGNRAQNPREQLGKLLRINPLKRRARWQMVALGLRNPWRFTFDAANGDLYIGDVGQGSWEEIDYRPAAQIGTLANYGWPKYEGRSTYDGSRPFTTKGRLVWPVATYTHAAGCSVTGGYVVGGRYYYGDFCSGTIWSFAAGSGRLSQPTQVGHVDNLSSFGVDGTGALYAVSLSGGLYKLR
jgi:glucose/arabinose dehydrogenase